MRLVKLLRRDQAIPGFGTSKVHAPTADIDEDWTIRYRRVYPSAVLDRREAMKAVSPSPALSVHLEGWLFLMILSVREVFQTMLATKVAPVFEPSEKLHLEWTAMVGLAGELRGVLMFSCDEKSAVRITSKMLGVPLSGPNEQTADALGEVCNMIAGSFKHKVNRLNERCALSPPTVVNRERLSRVPAGIWIVAFAQRNLYLRRCSRLSLSRSARIAVSSLTFTTSPSSNSLIPIPRPNATFGI